MLLFIVNLGNIGIINTGEFLLWISEFGQSCKFLFPMKTRKLLFYIKTFDSESALQKLKVLIQWEFESLI
jgi:hypothetical protein